MSFTFLLKQNLQKAFYSSGLWRFRLKSLGMKPLFVLMYHRVLESDECEGVEEGIYVAPDVFDCQVAFLKNHFELIDFADLKEIQNGKRTPQKPLCMITFDDGWEDNYRRAFPVLKKHGAKAVIFLTTGLVGTNKRFWFDTVYRLILQNHHNQTFLEMLKTIFMRENLSFPAETTDAKDFAKAALGEMKRIEGKTLLNQVQQLEGMFSGLKEERTLLHELEVREMQKAGVEFQSHGKRHLILTRLSKEDAREEMVQSKRDLELSITAREPLAFAFPNGDYSDDLVEAVRQSGYDFAVTTEAGWNPDCLSAKKLKRIDIHHKIGSDIPSFVFRLLVR
jgi:peptidoglycan/xylan/chitin deacetylase (PgdA/CDA1 family)